MSNIRLTQRQIDALKPRKKTFDVRQRHWKVSTRKSLSLDHDGISM